MDKFLKNLICVMFSIVIMTVISFNDLLLYYNICTAIQYVIYVFATDLKDPSKVIAEPSGLLIGPRGSERTGDVSNVVFTNGAIVNEKNEVFIYYASADTRMHVATTALDRLIDFTFNTPRDPGRSPDCVKQRCSMIEKNMEFLKNN